MKLNLQVLTLSSDTYELKLCGFTRICAQTRLRVDLFVDKRATMRFEVTPLLPHKKRIYFHTAII